MSRLLEGIQAPNEPTHGGDSGGEKLEEVNTSPVGEQAEVRRLSTVSTDLPSSQPVTYDHGSTAEHYLQGKFLG